MSHPAVICENEFSVARFQSSVRREADQFFLLREMHHRFANSFTVLNGMLRREFASSAQPELQETLGRCEARIVALGNLHRFLMIGGRQEWISVQFYIERLCEALVEAVLKPLGVRCEASADDGIYPSEHCELLGLIIAELATNAAKHAFRGRDDSLLRVEFINNTESWICVVSDNGRGSPAMPSGAGSRILEPMLRALDANLVRKSGSGGTSVAVTGKIQRRHYRRSA